MHFTMTYVYTDSNSHWTSSIYQVKGNRNNKLTAQCEFHKLTYYNRMIVNLLLWEITWDTLVSRTWQLIVAAPTPLFYPTSPPQHTFIIKLTPPMQWMASSQLELILFCYMYYTLGKNNLTTTYLCL